MKITRFSSVLVTGGAGFIGSHIVDRLVAQGLDVGVLDNMSTGSRSNLTLSSNLRVHSGDVSDPAFVKRIVGDYEVVIHAAALVGTGSSTGKSLELYSSNVTGTVNLLEAAVDSNVQRFIYASSAAVYGETSILPITEDTVPHPQSPYAFSKLEGEKYCQLFGATYGLETVCLRFFNVYGSRQRPGPYSGVISSFIGRLSKRGPPVIFGDGTQTRDFVHVTDVVEANLLAIAHDPSPDGVFNICTGKPTSINELALRLCELTHATDIKPVNVPPRVGDIKHSCGDFRKAREVFGFEPHVRLDDGLKELIAAVKVPEQVAAHSAPS